MGLGEAMMEEQAFRACRRRATARSSTRSPRCSNTRADDARDAGGRDLRVEDPDGAGPFGAKEVGQGPLLPIMPAVANAVFDAVGVRVDEIPVTPEKRRDQHKQAPIAPEVPLGFGNMAQSARSGVSR
jgi:4-hydroxybenzoyl-CoA reductase subunit alpha